MTRLVVSSPVARRRRRASSPAALATALLALLWLAGCAGRRAAPAPEPGGTQRGVASWYGPGFHGRTTANGETYDMHAATAAHRELPFDTIVEVRNLANGRRVRVRINDRGPFVRGRIIDLSYRAAEDLGMIGPGTARVELRVVATPPRAGRGGSWVVQAGAFRDPGRARDLARRLRSRHPTATVRSAGGWHRVHLGPFPTRREAERAARALSTRGVEAAIMRN